jgi:hypothetical protein
VTGRGHGLGVCVYVGCLFGHGLGFKVAPRLHACTSLCDLLSGFISYEGGGAGALALGFEFVTISSLGAESVGARRRPTYKRTFPQSVTGVAQRMGIHDRTLLAALGQGRVAARSSCSALSLLSRSCTLECAAAACSPAEASNKPVAAPCSPGLSPSLPPLPQSLEASTEIAA